MSCSATLKHRVQAAPLRTRHSIAWIGYLKPATGEGTYQRANLEHKWREISARESATHRSEEGLEPVNEKTGKTELPSSPGQILASLEPATAAAFVELLHTEYGFSDVQVARILEALQRTACSMTS